MRPVRRADHLTTFLCAVVMKSGNFNFLEPCGPLQACNGTDLHLREVYGEGIFCCCVSSLVLSPVSIKVEDMFFQLFTSSVRMYLCNEPLLCFVAINLFVWKSLNRWRQYISLNLLDTFGVTAVGCFPGRHFLSVKYDGRKYSGLWRL